jgi:hypothetical protein
MNRTNLGVAAAGLAALAVLVVGASTLTHPPGAPPTANQPNAPPTASHASLAPTTNHANAPPTTNHPRGQSPDHPRRARAHASAPARTAHRPSGPFRLLVHTAAATINVPVAPFTVASHQIVDPPHDTMRQWNTAAWIAQSTYPAEPGRGTAYIYGHACQYIVCSFNDLIDARVGDTAQITTRTAELIYRVDRIGLGPKTASSLPVWAADSTVPNRIVLVTCAYETNGASPNNLIVVAHLAHQSSTL